MKTYRGVDVQIHIFLTSVLVEVGGQLHVPAALPPGTNPRYPLYRWLGGPQSRSGRDGEVKTFLLPLPLVVQPIASRYTD
jgi:hypothetical protein